MNTRIITIGLVGALVALFVGEATAEVVTWRVEGETREAIVYAPSTPPVV